VSSEGDVMCVCVRVCRVSMLEPMPMMMLVLVLIDVQTNASPIFNLRIALGAFGAAWRGLNSNSCCAQSGVRLWPWTTVARRAECDFGPEPWLRAERDFGLEQWLRAERDFSSELSLRAERDFRFATFLSRAARVRVRVCFSLRGA